ncbi:hypothetical protein FB446DRAFT_655583, partial [Lentinula raphanica]
LDGGLIRYGQAEPWKAMINLIGRSKPTRAASSRKSRQKSDGHPPDTKQELLSKSPTKEKLLRSASSRKSGQKSDGRPPDTKQDLLSKSPTKEKLLQSKQKPVSSGVVVGPASYRWIENSCWIDSALDILYCAISNDYASFSTRFSSTTQTERPIRDLYNLAENQALILRDPSYDLWDTLSHQRNSFREKLVKWRIIKNNHSHDNIFEWFPKLMKAKLSEDTDNDNWTQTYFQSMFATIKYCSGEGQNGQHCQIRSNAEIRYYITLKDHICGQFKGDISAYFQMIANVNHVPEAFPSCWRTRNGIPECKGSHTDVRFLLSFPVVLALEEEELDGAGATEFWDFPKTLCPFKAGDLRRTTYDIVGRVFFSQSKRHYITRFISNDKKTVWTYDDMNHHGFPYMEPNSSVESHLTGRYPTLNLPSDFVGVFVIYHLRGGTAMQEKIFSSQLAAAHRIHHIIISRSKFERLAPSDLTWLMNPFQVTTIDYNEVSIPHTPTAEAPLHARLRYVKFDVSCLIYTLIISTRPGKGALVRHGKYHYPVQIIYTSKPLGRTRDEFHCTVKFWRGCQFPGGQAPPPSIDVVDQDMIVDELWGKQSERRKIRLGKWTHALPVLSSDEILDHFEAFPFTDEVEKALRPHVEELTKLYEQPDALSSLDVPAKVYINPLKGVEAQIIPYSGNLTIEEQAQIANWFELNISHTTPAMRFKWFGLLPYAHAMTLFIDYRLHANNLDIAEEPRSKRIQGAWEQQKSLQMSRPSRQVDVDMECLRALETGMFMRSEEAGIAGRCQWGLDAGYHQDNWDPYEGLQGLGCDEFFEETEDALEVSSFLLNLMIGSTHVGNIQIGSQYSAFEKDKSSHDEIQSKRKLVRNQVTDTAGTDHRKKKRKMRR